jgi:glycerol uptake facilitator-like aquaporin
MIALARVFRGNAIRQPASISSGFHGSAEPVAIPRRWRKSGFASGGVAAADAVGSYIAAAYCFTSSTSSANPAVTLARAASDTVVGIRPRDVPGFVIGQVAGAAAAFGS